MFSTSMIVNLFLASMLCYFIYHTVAGNRGLVVYLGLGEKIRSKDLELQSLVSEREKMESKVRALTPGDIDLDLLDEIARRDLGLIHRNEKCFSIILNGKI